MKPEEQRIAIAEACGYQWLTGPCYITTHHFGQYNDSDLAELKSLNFILGRHGKAIAIDTYGLNQTPDYPRSFQDLRGAEITLGLHDTDNLELRVKWINALRMVVSRRCPRNNSGSPMVSDIDLLTASEEERCEALVRTIGKWPKKSDAKHS